VHHWCCADGGAEGGATSLEAPREEVSRRRGGAPGAGDGPKVGMEGGYVWGG
jgi:hypothetical protein